MPRCAPGSNPAGPEAGSLPVQNRSEADWQVPMKKIIAVLLLAAHNIDLAAAPTQARR